MNSRAFANQERKQQAQRMSRISRSLLILLATILSFGCIGLLAVDQLYRPDSFVIDKLKISGKFRYMKPQQVEQVVAQKAVGNFFSIELNEIKVRIEKMAWVQDAEVRREWPNTLAIKVTEQRPVMRWGDAKWVNSRGDVIELPSIVSVPGSIVLNGNEDDAPLMLQQALKWNKRVSVHGLQLLSLRLSESHAFHLRLFDGSNHSEFDLLLGRRDSQTRLTRFLMLYEQQFRGTNQQLVRVDARYPDGLAVNARVQEVEDQLAINQHQQDSFTGNQK